MAQLVFIDILGLRSQLLDSGYSGKEESVNLRKDLTKVMDEKDELILQINDLESQVQNLQEALKETIHEKQMLECLEVRNDDTFGDRTIDFEKDSEKTDLGVVFEDLIEEMVLLPIRCDPVNAIEFLPVSEDVSDQEDVIFAVETENLLHEDEDADIQSEKDDTEKVDEEKDILVDMIVNVKLLTKNNDVADVSLEKVNSLSFVIQYSHFNVLS